MKKLLLLTILFLSFSLKSYSQNVNNSIPQQIVDLYELRDQSIIVYGCSNSITDDIGDAAQSLYRVYYEYQCNPIDTTINSSNVNVTTPAEIRAYLQYYIPIAESNANLLGQQSTCTPLLLNDAVIWQVIRYITAVTDAGNY